MSPRSSQPHGVEDFELRNRRFIAIAFLLMSLSTDRASGGDWLSWCWNTSSSQEATIASSQSAIPCVSRLRNVADLDFCSQLGTCLDSWFKRQRRACYGIRVDLREQTSAPPQLVLYIHGLNSRPEDLKQLVQEASRAGHVCGTYRYPNDQSITLSAIALANDLRSLRQRWSTTEVTLVTHSMGGLVARAMIENPKIDPGCVTKLVMVAPPNHGSLLAQHACSLDIWEFIRSPDRRREAGLIAGSFVDGQGQAIRDIRPGSDFLQRLNAQTRNADVKYSLVLGTGGPLRRRSLRGAQQLLSIASRRCRWVSTAERQFEQHVLASDELFAGYGDGFVAVRRGQLDGVADLVIERFSHASILGRRDTAGVARARAEILARL